MPRKHHAVNILNTTSLKATSAAAPDHDHEGLVALSRH
jgi:hypothetical protein